MFISVFDYIIVVVMNKITKHRRPLWDILVMLAAMGRPSICNDAHLMKSGGMIRV